MSVRHKRRSIHAEAIAPWAALSFVLLIWWAGAKALNWVRPGHQYPLMSFGARVDPSVPKVKPVDTAPPHTTITSADGGPTISANTMISSSDLASLRSRSLLLPVRGIVADDLESSFHDARGSSRHHEAIDILAPRGTEVLAVEDGKVAKMFTSDAGGLTLYQFDPSETFVYYYAHLDRYASGIKEGMVLRRGDVIGVVGTTGNAPKDTPHLHFAIAKLDADRRWWGGTALDPFLVWRDPSESYFSAKQ
ncbi:MAG TPA: M23 family metallopeptidase [Vicinamibacterales bacterium]|nr:M23 family metallopeptidase [Vicinamibacterales bacterium]